MRIVRGIVGSLICLVVWCTCALSLLALRLFPARRNGRCEHGGPGQIRLLLIGRFDSRNWCRAHLSPLVGIPRVEQIVAVVDGAIIHHPKIVVERPPRWLRCIVGRSPARSLWAIRTALSHRPDVVLGYNFFPAAVSALLSARLVGARSLYSMTAGPLELTGDRVATEFSLITEPNRVTRLLMPLALRLCRHFDVVVVRGHRAQRFLNQWRAARRVAIIPGSIDVRRFRCHVGRRDYDLVFLGRLASVKRPERFIRVVEILARRRPGVRAAVAGDGPLMEELQELTQSLNLDRHVHFLGHIEKCEEILHRSKLFVLTSRCEGLSIAMAEAMAAGVVPVVADVGDLAELVTNGITGWRVAPEDLEDYVHRITELLDDQALWQRMSRAARLRAIENNSATAVTEYWDHLLTSLSGGASLTARSPSALSPAKTPSGPNLVFR